MAKYNERFAIGVEDFLRPPQYDRLAAEIDKQGVLNAANQFNNLGRIQSAVAQGEYNVFAAKEGGQQQLGAANAGMWTDIAGGALSGLSGFAKNGGFNLGGGGQGNVKDLSNLAYDDPTNFSWNAQPKYLDTPNIDTSWSGWENI